MKIIIKYVIAVILISLAASSLAVSEYEKKMVKEVNLNGTWKFSIMQTEGWKNENFNDSGWDEIKAPGEWENQGYNGYNGYGFYRKKIEINKEFNENQMYLVLGYIDDVDEVYFNGVLIGSTGSFPPNYNTAYNAKRSYFIPESIIKPGKVNTIAIKVFDMTGVGGIVKGDLGIYTQEFPIKSDIDLVGQWKFTTRSNDDFKNPDYDDTNWDDIMVPGVWENQGYRNYDGCAWYRKQFQVKKGIAEEYMVMMAGKIDDIDQVFLNGTWIGQTGDDKDFLKNRQGNNENFYKSERAYIFPSCLLKEGTNIVAIKVIDGQGEGGIYDGPVGIVKQSEFINYWKKRSQKNRSNNW
jgi:hypothetical protein